MKKVLVLSASLLALAACDSKGNGIRVDGGDDFSENTITSYAAVPVQDSTQWQIANGQLVATGPSPDDLLMNPSVPMSDGYVEAVVSRADDGGLVTKWTQDGEFYLLAFHDDGSPLGSANNLSIDRVSRGERTVLWQGDVAWPRGSTHTVRLETSGSAIRAYFDGNLQGQVTDTNDAGVSGLFGFRNNGPDSSWKTVFESYAYHVTG